MINLSKTILAYVFVLPVLFAGVLKVSGAGKHFQCVTHREPIHGSRITK